MQQTLEVEASPRLGGAVVDPLPSWNDGPTKEALIGFVEAVTDEGGRDHVPPAERIAVFDNDGTLWTELPVPVQLAFAMDRVEALAAEHPEWRITNYVTPGSTVGPDPTRLLDPVTITLDGTARPSSH